MLTDPTTADTVSGIVRHLLADIGDARSNDALEARVRRLRPLTYIRWLRGGVRAELLACRQQREGERKYLLADTKKANERNRKNLANALKARQTAAESIAALTEALDGVAGLAEDLANAEDKVAAAARIERGLRRSLGLLHGPEGPGDPVTVGTQTDCSAADWEIKPRQKLKPAIRDLSVKLAVTNLVTFRNVGPVINNVMAALKLTAPSFSALTETAPTTVSNGHDTAVRCLKEVRKPHPVG